MADYLLIIATFLGISLDAGQLCLKSPGFNPRRLAVLLSEKYLNTTAATAHAVHIEPGLRSQFPENGNISNIRRRLSAISLPETQFRSPETDSQFAKARHWRAFVAL